MGKPATHSRNIRRRRKLQYERNPALRDPDDPTVGVNAIPLGNHEGTGVAETTAQTIVDDHEELTMASLSNKNKRRGFKSAMGKELPSKIVFSEQVDSNNSVNVRDHGTHSKGGSAVGEAGEGFAPAEHLRNEH
jgi:hypothetical protein